jgi:Peptidase family C25
LLVSDRGFEGVSDHIGSVLSAATTVQTLNRSAINDDALMQSEIVNSINQGPLIVNYVGHGSVTVWTGSGLLNKDNAATFTNGGRLSVFVMTTCLNSYSHDAFVDSLAEILFKNPQGGAVATWSSSGKTAPEGQTDMNLSLYQLILSNPSMTLGDAVRNAKMSSPDIDVRHTWILLGDPSMKLLSGPPPAQTKTSLTDTLKARALSRRQENLIRRPQSAPLKTTATERP